MSADDRPDRATEEESRRNRPYRLLVGAILGILIVVPSILILRGIVRTLDRLPTVSSIGRAETVDVRALRACAEDLERLDGRIRRVAGELFMRSPGGEVADSNLRTAMLPLERERVEIIARCALDDPQGDPAVEDLALAANEIEAVIRSYGLLYDRHREEAVPRLATLQQAIRRASAALETRER